MSGPTTLSIDLSQLEELLGGTDWLGPGANLAGRRSSPERAALTQCQLLASMVLEIVDLGGPDDKATREALYKRVLHAIESQSMACLELELSDTSPVATKGAA